MNPSAHATSAPPTPSAERRLRVVTEARQLFVEHGFHATGVAQISDKSGVAVQQLYRDFGNKEGIVAEIVEQGIGELLQAFSVTAAIPDTDFAGWFKAAVSGLLDDLEPRLLLEIQAEASRNPRIAQIVQDADRRIRGALAAALSRYASPAAASSPIGTAVDLLLVSVFGVISRRLIHPELDTESLLAALSRQLGQVLDVPVAPEPAI